MWLTVVNFLTHWPRGVSHPLEGFPSQSTHLQAKISNREPTHQSVVEVGWVCRSSVLQTAA
jgi:hypothetical protein